jgi:hypothetical protein
VSPVKYELGSYIRKDGIVHSHVRSSSLDEVMYPICHPPKDMLKSITNFPFT